MIPDIKFYLTLLKRRLPVMVLLFLLSAIAGVVIAQRLPTLYKTSATLLVESAQIEDDSRSVQVDASERLEVIQQRLMTRANLLDIARETRAIPGLNALTPDEIVSEMRQSTSIRRSSGRNRATLMTINFEGHDPSKVAAVVNRYVTVVLSTSSDFGKTRAEAQLDFFQQELQTLSENLDQQSAKIVAFKTEHRNALPENLDYRLSRQAQLQERVARAERDLDGLMTQRASIERIYESTGALTAPNSVPQTSEQRELQALESELRAALSIYSEQNPKVRNLRSRIEGLTAAVQVSSTGNDANEVAQATQASALDISLTELDTRMEALRSEIANATRDLTQISTRIEQTPINGIALAAMERDLQNIQNLYSAAVSRLAQARMGERIELSSKGERITVLEAANVPSTPSSPNRPAVMAMGIGMGLGLAAGLFFLLELINQSIRRPVDVERSLEITPLATIPRIESLGRKRLRRFNQIMILLIIVVGVPVALWAIDTYYLPLDLIFDKIKDKLL